jgi:hypothetical protein
MIKSRYFFILIQACLGLGLLGYVHLGSYTRMIADDFCSAYYANHLGLLRSIWYWYINWSGRYSAFAADWFVLKVALGPPALKYIVPLMTALWLVFLTAFIHLELKKSGSFTLLHSTVLGSSFLFSLYQLSPDTSQSLFWWNGARAYSLPLMLLTGGAALYRVVGFLPNLPAALGVGSSFLLLFLIGGLGETYVIGQAGFLVLMIAMKIIRSGQAPGRELSILFAGLCGTLVSALVIIMAPGNAIRQSLLPPTLDVTALLSVSAQGYGVFIHQLITDPQKVSGLAGLLLLCIWAGMQRKVGPLFDVRGMPLLLIGGIALSFIGFPPGVYGYSELPPARTMIIPVFFLLSCAAYASYWAGGLLAGRFPNLRARQVVALGFSLVLIAYSTVIDTQEMFERRDDFIRFANTWDETNARILEARAAKATSVNIPAMNNWANLEAPTDNPRHWVTRCYSQYYGIQVIGPPFEEIYGISPP